MVKLVWSIWGYLDGYNFDQFIEESLNSLIVGCEGVPKITPFDRTYNAILLIYHCPKLCHSLSKQINILRVVFYLWGE